MVQGGAVFTEPHGHDDRRFIYAALRRLPTARARGVRLGAHDNQAEDGGKFGPIIGLVSQVLIEEVKRNKV